MPDIYDEEIERLTKNPGNIESSWIGCRPLFAYAQSDVSGNIEEDKENRISAGCLTMIKNAPFKYGVILNGKLHEELTEQIAQDSVSQLVERILHQSTSLYLQNGNGN
jgi:hypothetical protein